MRKNYLSELLRLGYLLAALFVVIEITFIRGNILTNLRLALTYFLLLFMPGYFVASYFLRKAGFIEKIVVGAVVMLGIITVLGYFSGIIIGDYRYSFIADAIVLAIFAYLWLKKDESPGEEKNNVSEKND